MHSEGIYSWNLLYELGENKFKYMKAYIQLLRYYNKSRERAKLTSRKNKKNPEN